MFHVHVNTGRVGRPFFYDLCSEIRKNLEFLLFRSLANALFYGGSSRDVSWERHVWCKRIFHINLILAISISFFVAGAGLTNISGF